MLKHRIGLLTISAATTACCIAGMTLSVEGECVQQWSPVGGDFRGSVQSIAVFDDGDGSALYVGGPGIDALRKWDGKHWEDVRMPLSHVTAMAVHDDGAGPALYLGGSFSDGVWKYDGKSFTQLPGINLTTRALISHDDGSGPALYAGLGANGNGDYVQRWSVEKSFWEPVGIEPWTTSGCIPIGWNSGVWEFASFDLDGDGPQPTSLIAGGYFTTAPGVASKHLVRWDGSGWFSMGNINNRVTAMVCQPSTTFENSGKLFCGFMGLPCPPIGGATLSLSSLDQANQWTGLAQAGGANGPSLHSLVLFDDDGPGPRSSRLYAGGNFTVTSGGSTLPPDTIAVLTGSSWSVPGGSFGGGAHVLVTFDDGSGPALYAGGGTGVAKLTLAPCCAADIDASQNSAVDVDDLLVVINQWGASGGTADITVNGTVDVDDLLAVINAWGPCP